MSEDRRLSVLGALEACVRREREGMARFLECLGEFDAREWYSVDAFSSSFAYLTEHLKIPPGSAWKRLVVARAARKFPVILSLLREGKVHLTGLSLVAKMLDESNVDFLLGVITGKTTRQIEEFVADFKTQTSEGGESTSLKGSGGAVTPLGLGNWKVEFVADAELKALMDSAMELCPIGTDLASMVRKALEAFVQRMATRKFGAPLQRQDPEVASPSSESGSTLGTDASGKRSRYIPAKTRRAVYERDGGQCAFVDDHGRRCSGRRGLQFDHLKPFCLGGGNGEDNIRLLCPTHNRHEAREVLGRRFMGRWILPERP